MIRPVRKHIPGCGQARGRYRGGLNARTSRRMFTCSRGVRPMSSVMSLAILGCFNSCIDSDVTPPLAAARQACPVQVVTDMRAYPRVGDPFDARRSGMRPMIEIHEQG
jgi:hypothetical protein